MKRLKLIIILLSLTLLQILNVSAQVNTNAVDVPTEAWEPLEDTWKTNELYWEDLYSPKPYKWKDTFLITAELEITSEPVDKNQALQSVLEQQVDQMYMLDTGLANINSTLASMPEKNAEIRNMRLNMVESKIRKATDQKVKANRIGNILSILYIIGFIALFMYEKKTFWLKKNRTLMIVQFVGGLLVLRVFIPGLILGSSASDLYFWDVFKYIF